MRIMRCPGGRKEDEDAGGSKVSPQVLSDTPTCNMGLATGTMHLSQSFSRERLLEQWKGGKLKAGRAEDKGRLIVGYRKRRKHEKRSFQERERRNSGRDSMLVCVFALLFL